VAKKTRHKIIAEDREYRLNRMIAEGGMGAVGFQQYINWEMARDQMTDIRNKRACASPTADVPEKRRDWA